MTHKFGVHAVLMGLVASLGLAGCETVPDKQTTGTVVGGVLGAAVGSQIGGGTGRTVAIIGGAALGGLLGNVIGKKMDESDRRKMTQALDQNAAGQSTKWKNDSTGATYTVTPKKTFVRDGRECRTFDQEAVVDGEPRKMTGTACKRADGESWEVTT
jgi:surface antigen